MVGSSLFLLRFSATHPAGGDSREINEMNDFTSAMQGTNKQIMEGGVKPISHGGGEHTATDQVSLRRASPI